MTLAGAGIYPRGETLSYNPTYGNGQCTDWAERQFHAWTGTYINTLSINGHSGNALDWAYNAAHYGWTVGTCSAWNYLLLDMPPGNPRLSGE